MWPQCPLELEEVHPQLEKCFFKSFKRENWGKPLVSQNPITENSEDTRKTGKLVEDAESA